MTVKPDLIDALGDASTQKFSVTDNLDREEDKYETTVTTDFGKDVKPWFTGRWEGTDYVLQLTANDGGTRRKADLTFTTFNPDESIRLVSTVTVSQDVAQQGNASVTPTVLEFPAEGGAKAFTVHYGDFNYCSPGFDPYPPHGGIKANWGQDYLSRNRYANDLFVTAAPNLTGQATSDTIVFSFAKDADTPFNDKYHVRVVVRQAAGPYSMEQLKNLFVGTWIGVNGPDQYGDYWYRRIVFGADGTCSYQNRFTSKGGTVEGEWGKQVSGTYTINGYEQGTRYLRINITSDKLGNFVEVYPHFLRNGGFYFEREE
jgi:hypothetical protein